MLDRLEAALRSAFEGVGRLLPGKLEPLELAGELQVAMRRSQMLSAYGTYVANGYEVRLNPEDLQRFEGMRADVEQELTRSLREFAAEEDFVHGPRLGVGLVADPKVRVGHAQAVASHNDEPMMARLTAIGGVSPVSFEVRGETTLGRGTDCDIVIDAPSASRRHARLEWTYRGYVVRDLNSTNGTFVNGAQVTEELLRDGDLIEVGEASLRFTCHPE